MGFGKLAFGFVLVGMGALLLGAALGYLPHGVWPWLARFWPVLLVGFGLALLANALKNALLGVMLYLMLAIGLFLNWPPSWLLLMTLPAVAMSAFLGWSLISRGLQCRICWTGHAANVTLAVLLGIRAL